MFYIECLHHVTFNGVLNIMRWKQIALGVSSYFCLCIKQEFFSLKVKQQTNEKRIITLQEYAAELNL